MNYRDFMEQQQTIRSDLTTIMNADKITFMQLAKDIGIAIGTLFNFVRNEKIVQFRTLSKIQDYVLKNKEK